MNWFLMVQVVAMFSAPAQLQILGPMADEAACKVVRSQVLERFQSLKAECVGLPAPQPAAH